MVKCLNVHSSFLQIKFINLSILLFLFLIYKYFFIIMVIFVHHLELRFGNKQDLKRQ